VHGDNNWLANLGHQVLKRALMAKAMDVLGMERHGHAPLTVHDVPMP
jgi:hypothetical protein